MSYDDIINSCKEKIRYGDLWQDFSVEELVEYGRIKAKRGLLLYKNHNIEKFEDDIMDAINILVMSIQRIKYHREYGNFDVLPI